MRGDINVQDIVIQTSQPIEGNKIDESGAVIPFGIDDTETLVVLSNLWLEAASWHRWMWQKFYGISSVQFPIDYFLIQQAIIKANPHIIIETGTAFGGTSLYLASLLHHLGRKKGQIYTIDKSNPEITQGPRIQAKALAMQKWGIEIIMLNGESTDPKILDHLSKSIDSRKRVVVFLDSDHDRDYVREELEIYERFIMKGSYFLVCDTYCRIVSDEFKKERHWDFKADPLGSVEDFLSSTNTFQLDKELNSYPLSTFNGGVLVRTKPRKPRK